MNSNSRLLEIMVASMFLGYMPWYGFSAVSSGRGAFLSLGVGARTAPALAYFLPERNSRTTAGRKGNDERKLLPGGKEE